MSTEYMRATTDVEREKLAHKVAKLRVDGVPWDGPGGIATSMRLVSSATQGRALLRRYQLDAGQGGPVEIRASYDRHEIIPATGQRKGYRGRPPRSKADRVDASGVQSADSLDGQGVGQESHPNPAASSHSVTGNLGGSADPLIAFVRRIAEETGREVPTPNPDGPTESPWV